MPGSRRHNTIHNGKRKRLPLISIILTAGFLGLTVFTLLYVLLGENPAPYDGDAAVPAQADASADAVAPAAIIIDTDPSINDDAAHGPDEPGDNKNENGSVISGSESSSIIQMDTSDINRGYLILVNDDHAYSIPNDLDLKKIVEAVSPEINVQLDGFHLLRSIMTPLNDMMLDFLSATDNRSVYIVGAYRSYEIQQAILAQHGDRASPVGHSEHHTGLAFDLGIFNGGERSTFTGTGSTAWFMENSYKYGYILRYPGDKTHVTGVQYEPWHFRFVGLPHSYIMFQNNWVLEEYIELLRGYTSEEPFTAEYDAVTYGIFFTTDPDIPVPIDMEYDISGNNIDGFIVTLSH